MKIRACLALVSLVACTKATTSPSDGGLPPIVAPSVDLGVCILEQAAGDPACRLTGGDAGKCAADLAAACGSDAASVARVLTAAKRLADAGAR
jgi:hypothetical protein